MLQVSKNMHRNGHQLLEKILSTPEIMNLSEKQKKLKHDMDL